VNVRVAVMIALSVSVTGAICHIVEARPVLVSTVLSSFLSSSLSPDPLSQARKARHTKRQTRNVPKKDFLFIKKFPLSFMSFDNISFPGGNSNKFKDEVQQKSIKV
jgi:hypothetical protein